MCLDYVDIETEKEVRYAYKLFNLKGFREYYPLAHKGTLWNILKAISLESYWILYTKFGKTYLMGQEYKSSKRKIKAGDGTRYKSGFHCFVNKVDAIACSTDEFGKNPILRVAVEDIVASGYQEGDVIVARKMRLIDKCQTDT